MTETQKGAKGRQGSNGSVLLDDRSAELERTTGWERYAREVRDHTHAEVLRTSTTAPVSSTAGLVWGDWSEVPRRARTAQVAHFLSFPPSALVRPTRRTIWTLHDLTWWRYPETASRGGRWYYSRLARAAVKRAHLVTDTQAVADEIIAELGVHRDDVSVAVPGVRVPAQVTPPSTMRPYLLAVGTLEPRKNLHRLLEAYERSGLASDIDLVLIGRAGWGVPPHGARVISGLTDEELHGWYAAAVALVSPSIYEGFGLPVVEALAHGTPVVCSDIPVFREVAGDQAVFVDPYDVEDLSHALGTAARAADDAQRRAARRAWAARYTWDTTARQLAELYARWC